MIQHSDSLEFLKTCKDYEFDINYSDPPYGLGSEIIIKEDGKVDYKNARDFMNKWKMPTGEYWDNWFKEAFRTLKYGGYCIMFSIDRCCLLFKYYATKAGFIENQSMYWYFICSDEKTELLTKRGWLKWCDIQKDDIVLTMNIENETSEWQNIEKIHVYDVENQDMVRFQNRNIDQFVTHNHRILHKSTTNRRYKYGSWQFKEANTFRNRKCILSIFPLAFPNTEHIDIIYGNKMCELLGWIFTDGSYGYADNSIRIYQNSPNESKVNKLRNLLIELGIDYKEYTREREWDYKTGIEKKFVEHCFYFNNELTKEIRKKYPERKPTFDLLNLSFDERESLFIGMMLGDGSYKMVNRYQDIKEAYFSDENFNGCFGKNKETAEFFQALCSSLGFSTSIRKRDDKFYVVNVSHKQTTEIQRAKNKVFEEKYTGKVWGLSVDNQNYCIRRNGKVSFTGNSNMPKAADLSKNIDKHFGAEREVVGKKTELAKKYDGYKYSIAPTKQTNETILIFQKPYKTNSCLHDTLAYENGDSECCCGAINIDGNRVYRNPNDVSGWSQSGNKESENHSMSGKNYAREPKPDHELGRFPAQTFIDSNTAKILDKQSGDLKGGGAISEHQQNNQSKLNFTNGNHRGFEGFDDVGGCSKILHKCDYEKGELDLYLYEPKVSGFERNAGADNNHPTLKPISLNYRILNHFKTPNKQKIVFPFAGAGSEIIGGLKAGFADYKGSEISEEYITIANKRIEYWTSVDFELDKSQHEEKQRDNNTHSIYDLF